MRARIVILMPALVGVAFAQMPVPFAKSDRIVTIETWFQREGTVWAVQKDQIVIYKQSDQGKVELKLTKPLAASQVQAIREAVASLPRDAFGFHHLGGYGAHPPLLRVHLTDDGKWTNHRIEASGYTPDWSKRLFVAVSEACPPELKLDYDSLVSKYLAKLGVSQSPGVQKMTFREFYGETKSWWEFWK